MSPAVPGMAGQRPIAPAGDLAHGLKRLLIDERQELVLVVLFPRDPTSCGDRRVLRCRGHRIVFPSRPIHRAGHALIVDISVLVDPFYLGGFFITVLALVQDRLVDGRNVGESR